MTSSFTPEQQQEIANLIRRAVLEASAPKQTATVLFRRPFLFLGA